MEDEKYERARKRVHELKGFYSNLITFLVINLILLVINLVTTPKNLWFYWVTIFWGIAIVFQAVRVFTIRNKFMGEEWERKKIDELMKKDKERE